jgi:beta-1,4-mannosyl-glycoprotein beta-1,4-N-acetylglucosaminyltransferase
MAIYDCFMFNDENSVLELRLKYLHPIVDFFVIAESQMNFSGAEKPLHSLEIISELGLSEKILRVEYSFTEELLAKLSHPRGKYELEKFARNSLLSVVNSLPDKDLVMLSDVDEIPTVAQIFEGASLHEVVSLLTPLYYGKMNWTSPDGYNWNTVKLGPSENFKNQDLNKFKYKRFRVIKKNPGGHFSDQFKSVHEVIKKAQNSSHEEFNLSRDFQTSMFEYAQRYRINHFGRFYRKGMGLIKLQSNNSLNDIQKLALVSKICEFDFKDVRESKMKRVIASYRVSESWKSGQLPGEIDKVRPLEIASLLSKWIIEWLRHKSRVINHRIKLLLPVN